MALKAREITVFKSDAWTTQSNEENSAVADTISYQDADFDVIDVRFASGESVYVSLKNDEVSVLQFPSLQHFMGFLESKTRLNPSNPSLRYIFTSSHALQICTNATTLTKLSSIDGQVYTFTDDPRFPKCLGRHASSASTAEPIPYFSEVGVSKIASGGYYSCAISAKPENPSEEIGGELYVWGQAPPGTEREISVLRTAFSTASDDLDEFVSCVELDINGKLASVTDVAVGWGHILVAVEVTEYSGTNTEVSRAVFAAGCNNRRQLGLNGKTGSLGFVEEFTEVERLKDKKVVQMECSGWSSYIVVED